MLCVVMSSLAFFLQCRGRPIEDSPTRPEGPPFGLRTVRNFGTILRDVGYPFVGDYLFLGEDDFRSILCPTPNGGQRK